MLPFLNISVDKSQLTEITHFQGKWLPPNGNTLKRISCSCYAQDQSQDKQIQTWTRTQVPVVISQR